MKQTQKKRYSYSFSLKQLVLFFCMVMTLNILFIAVLIPKNDSTPYIKASSPYEKTPLAKANKNTKQKQEPINPSAVSGSAITGNNLTLLSASMRDSFSNGLLNLATVTAVSVSASTPATVLAASIPTLITTHEQEKEKEGFVTILTTRDTSLYEKRSESSKKLQKVPKDCLLSIDTRKLKKGWIPFSYNKKSGFIYYEDTNLLDKLGDSPPSVVHKLSSNRTHCKARTVKKNVPLYLKADANSTLIGSLDKKTRVEVLSQVEHFRETKPWFEIKVIGTNQTGYVPENSIDDFSVYIDASPKKDSEKNPSKDDNSSKDSEKKDSSKDDKNSSKDSEKKDSSKDDKNSSKDSEKKDSSKDDKNSSKDSEKKDLSKDDKNSSKDSEKKDSSKDDKNSSKDSEKKDSSKDDKNSSKDSEKKDSSKDDKNSSKDSEKKNPSKDDNSSRDSEEGTLGDSCEEISHEISEQGDFEHSIIPEQEEAASLDSQKPKKGCTDEISGTTKKKKDKEKKYFKGIKLQYNAKYHVTSNPLTRSMGVKKYNGHKETWYSQKTLPGKGLKIPGRHVAADGTIRDKDGYICVSCHRSFKPKHAVLMTSLGPAKVYDTGCAYGTVDIYVNWKPPVKKPIKRVKTSHQKAIEKKVARFRKNVA